MRTVTIQGGGIAKSTADIGEIVTLVICLLQDVRIICSNDADVITTENYCYVDEAGTDRLIINDRAEDFCYYCYSEAGITKSMVRKFYKSLFTDKSTKRQMLAVLNTRLNS